MSTIINFYPKRNDLIKPFLAKEMLPEWYKNQDSYNSFDHPTIKRCMPIFDAMTQGYMLVAQSDIIVDSQNPAGIIVNSDNDFDGQLFSKHDMSQYDKYPIPYGYHKDLLRVHPLWVIKTPPGYSTLFINPIHGGSKNLLALAGLIDTDNFISDGHLSFFVREDTEFKIKKGTPLVQAIPIKRESWSHQEMTVEETIQAITDQDNSGIMVDGVHQTGAYKKIFHVPKSFK